MHIQRVEVIRHVVAVERDADGILLVPVRHVEILHQAEIERVEIREPRPV